MTGSSIPQPSVTKAIILRLVTKQRRQGVLLLLALQYGVQFAAAVEVKHLATGGLSSGKASAGEMTSTTCLENTQPGVCDGLCVWNTTSPIRGQTLDARTFTQIMRNISYRPDFRPQPWTALFVIPCKSREIKFLQASLFKKDAGVVKCPDYTGSVYDQGVTHPCVDAGNPVHAAGEMQIYSSGKFGIDVHLNDLSGHYMQQLKRDPQYFSQAITPTSKYDELMKDIEVRFKGIIPPGIPTTFHKCGMSSAQCDRRPTFLEGEGPVTPFKEYSSGPKTVGHPLLRKAFSAADPPPVPPPRPVPPCEEGEEGEEGAANGVDA